GRLQSSTVPLAKTCRTRILSEHPARTTLRSLGDGRGATLCRTAGKRKELRGNVVSLDVKKREGEERGVAGYPHWPSPFHPHCGDQKAMCPSDSALGVA